MVFVSKLYQSEEKLQPKFYDHTAKLHSPRAPSVNNTTTCTCSMLAMYYKSHHRKELHVQDLQIVSTLYDKSHAILDALLHWFRDEIGGSRLDIDQSWSLSATCT